MCIKRITSWLLIVVVLITGLVVPTKKPENIDSPQAADKETDKDN